MAKSVLPQKHTYPLVCKVYDCMVWIWKSHTTVLYQ